MTVTTPLRVAPSPGALRYRSQEIDDRTILACDPPGGSRIVEALGDVATADHIAVVVPGNGHHLGNYFIEEGRNSPRARGELLLRTMQALEPDAHVAVVVWVGYRTPPDLAAAVSNTPAYEGAPELARAMAFGIGIGITTIAVAADARDGVLDRMRTLPMSPVAMLAGRSLADVLTALIELTILMCLGRLFGWQWHAGAGAGLAALGLLLLLRTAFSWTGILLGLLVSGPEAAMKYFSLVFPLAMVADTVVPTSFMPGWLAGPAGWNPLSATVIATRELFGNPTGPGMSWPAEHALLLAVVWPLAITTVCTALALGRLRRLSR